MATDISQLTQALGLKDGISMWKADMDDYLNKKKNLQFEPNPYKKVTHEFIKHQDTIYNPIIQKYTNPNHETKVTDFEKQNFVDVLAKNKDRALRYEQTYNILNFESKMKGLEQRPDYPQEKAWYFRPGKDTKQDYNILSNIDMKDHHFAEPEKRPEQNSAEKQKGKRVQADGLREYDIVTNRYLELHDLKEKTNEDIQRAEAALAFWKTHDYNILEGQYYDAKKENNFMTTQQEKAKTHGKDQVKKLPLTVQK